MAEPPTKKQFSDSDSDSEEERKLRPKNAVELQKIRLEKLMSRPEKPVKLPENKEVEEKGPAEFVRNVQGSSAGAGSGEFHVYRALRRKEYTRIKSQSDKAEEEKLQKEFHDLVEAKRAAADARTAKKREKRQKRKKAVEKKGRDKTNDPLLLQLLYFDTISPGR